MTHEQHSGGIACSSPETKSSLAEATSGNVALKSTEPPGLCSKSREDVNDEISGDVDRTLSRVISSLSGQVQAIWVKRSQRRGLFASFVILPEVQDAQSYDRRTKWTITFIISVAAIVAPLGSNILLPALSEIVDEFNTTSTITNLSIALYMLSMSIFPLWWSSFSESLGRRTIYVSSFMLAVLWNVLSAVAQNIVMLIFMRMLAGGASASVQAVGAGSIADVWEPKERGKAMGIFYLGPLCGPLFAPIVGGALAERWGWRSTQWALVIFNGIVLMLIFFGLPETLKKRKSVTGEDQEMVTNAPADNISDTALQRTRVVEAKTKRFAKMLRHSFIDPLSIILSLRFPPVALTVAYASVTFCCLYVLNISIESTFSSAPYKFSTLIVGLLYIPSSLGYIFASILGGRWIDSIMHREAVKAGRYDEKGKLIYRPEDRMKENAWLAQILYPGALIWYGWAAQQHTYWLVPISAGFFFGVGSMLVFGLATTMLTELMPKKASNGVAINNFVRNILSCVGTVVTSPLISALGNGWLFTILGIIAAASSGVIIAMQHYGQRWKKSMEARP